MPHRSTHTVATLELSAPSYIEIEEKLRGAGYEHTIDGDGMIDLTGIGVVKHNEQLIGRFTSIRENRVLYHLAQAFNEFTELDVQHPTELDEFMRAIHVAQGLIAIRTARAADPFVWPIKA